MLKATLDLKAGKIYVATTEKTFDPFIIVKARDMLQLMARGVSLQQARRVLEDGVFSDIIKIGNLCKNRETFIHRRQRLLGPDGATLKALELLTDSYIFIQGKTVSVIGDVKALKAVRRVVEDCMFNVHPIYHVKELMIRRELMKKPELAGENWDKYLPQFKKNITQKRIKKKKPQKEKKEYTPFPNAPEPSKIDKMIESGEYFMTEEQRKDKKDKDLKKQNKITSMERKVEKSKIMIAPEEKTRVKSEDKEDLVAKIKENSDKKRKVNNIQASDFVDKKKKRQRLE
jgi:ribosomal RNA assembly protein